ncbi:DarT ssDNA thymidine ADP-ribosyltransferase family protein [Stutzerimonas balearica]|uniref:DarT ssDNA thymidine ADP-ribosyltransferase family protein n=1 Tax=Stutzerimonas balearica TaxID=74829 RepID=UPI003F5C533C
MPKQAIQAHATEIQIPYLLHFTRVVNLPSIMAHGLYPIGRVSEIKATPAINDQYRLDGHRNSTSVSIGFPNCQMLYKYRMADQAVDWVILVLHPSILWAKNCAFCRHNAADARISSQPLPHLITPQAFMSMYEEVEGLLSREEQKLKPFDPTDVQAEVLVFDVIEPQYVAGVIFEKAAVRDACLPHLGERKTYIHAGNKGMFANRKYARTWG